MDAVLTAPFREPSGAPVQAASAMPPESRLVHPRQDLRHRFRDGSAPGGAPDPDAVLWRAWTFLPAAMATGVLLWTFLAWFATDGTTAIEAVLAALIGVGFFWIALTFVTVVGGAVAMQRRSARSAGPARPLAVALLVPIYEEDPWDVFGNAGAMLAALARLPVGHRYTLYVLSDTRDPRRARDEATLFAALRDRLPAGAVFYRRRAVNTDRKVGNVADWVERWGGAHDAMIVLDADSLMTARAIRALTDALSRDPAAGLIQSFPQLIGARTLFARSQQFANAVYGTALAEGLSRWTGHEGNYWGHNAIIRTRAFASSAGLPHLSGGRLILSHDFVEAGLLRRAGWTVRFMPRIRGSYEEAPPSLVDYCLRDRRWCRGNLQHLGLLGTSGLHALSRFHLFQGAMGYLMSPLWFALLALWAMTGVDAERSVINYFSPDDPTMPNWPEMSPIDHVWLMLVLYGLLLAPKVIAAVATLLAGTRLSHLGGGWRFAGSLLLEILIATAYAPVMMVQQTVAVGSALVGREFDWTPQDRAGGGHGLAALLRFHLAETILGGALLVGMATGHVSLWLSPIAASLALAVPLSALSERATGILPTPQELHRPPVAAEAQRWRAELRSMLPGA